MFTYLDPKVRSRLVNEGRLIRINAGGEKIEYTMGASSTDAHSLEILGPIPMPINTHEQ